MQKDTRYFSYKTGSEAIEGAVTRGRATQVPGSVSDRHGNGLENIPITANRRNIIKAKKNIAFFTFIVCPKKYSVNS